MTLRDNVIRTLKDLGGEIIDTNGLATRRLHEMLGANAPSRQATLSSLLSELERDGEIVRDQPNLKRTTRIAINRPGIRPGRKSLEVIVEQAGRFMAAQIEHDVQATIDAHVIAAQDGVEQLEDEVRRLKRHATQLKRQRDEARRERDARRREVETLRDNEQLLRERLRIAEQNGETWRRNALGRRSVRETLTTVREELDPGLRSQLDELMRELPTGGGEP